MTNTTTTQKNTQDKSRFVADRADMKITTVAQMRARAAQKAADKS